MSSRLWLDFVNTDDARRGTGEDVLDDFPTFLHWLRAEGALEAERVGGILRRAEQQPAGAGAVLADARRVRVAFRSLAECGAQVERARLDALAEINRVLGRSAGARRLDVRPDGQFVRTFAPVGDAFAGLMIPVVESAGDALVTGELVRVRRCVSTRCTRVFLDLTKNGRRRWCDMATCGNRAKAARHRERTRSTSVSTEPAPVTASGLAGTLLLPNADLDAPLA